MKTKRRGRLKALPRKRRGVARQHLSFLVKLRQLLGEGSDAAAFARVTRTIVEEGLAEYAVIDLAEPWRRLEISHADLSRIEPLRAAASRFAPTENGHLRHVAEYAQQEVVNAHGDALHAADLDFATGQVRAWMATPILERGEVAAVLTLVNTRRRFDEDDAFLSREIAGWMGLVLELSRPPKATRRSSSVRVRQVVPPRVESA